MEGRAGCKAGAGAIRIGSSFAYEPLGTNPMWLLIYYVAIVLVGDIAIYLVGLGVEYYWPRPIVSLTVFLSLYFVVLWAAWVLAVWFTKPKVVQVAPAA